MSVAASRSSWGGRKDAGAVAISILHHGHELEAPNHRAPHRLRHCPAASWRRGHESAPGALSSGCELVQTARPTARAFAKGRQVVFFVRRMDAVVVEAEADEQAVHAERGLEGGDNWNRTADA